MLSTLDPRIFRTCKLRAPSFSMRKSITPSARYSSGWRMRSTPVVGSSLVRRQVVPVDCKTSTISKTAGRLSSMLGKRKTRSEIESTTTLLGESLSIPSWTRSIRFTSPSSRPPDRNPAYLGLFGNATHLGSVDVGEPVVLLKSGKVHAKRVHFRHETWFRLIHPNVNALLVPLGRSPVEELRAEDRFSRSWFPEDQHNLSRRKAAI